MLTLIIIFFCITYIYKPQKMVTTVFIHNMYRIQMCSFCFKITNKSHKHSVKRVIWNLSFHCIERTLIFKSITFILVFPCLYTKYLRGILTNTKQNITRYKNCTITIYNALILYFFVFIRSSHSVRDIKYKIVFVYL